MAESTAPKNHNHDLKESVTATSKDQLSDLEERETEVDSGTSSSADENGPSPDGALDDSKESKNAGPM